MKRRLMQAACLLLAVTLVGCAKLKEMADEAARKREEKNKEQKEKLQGSWESGSKVSRGPNIPVSYQLIEFQPDDKVKITTMDGKKTTTQEGKYVVDDGKLKVTVEKGGGDKNLEFTIESLEAEKIKLGFATGKNTRTVREYAKRKPEAVARDRLIGEWELPIKTWAAPVINVNDKVVVAGSPAGKLVWTMRFNADGTCRLTTSDGWEPKAQKVYDGTFKLAGEELQVEVEVKVGNEITKRKYSWPVSVSEGKLTLTWKEQDSDWTAEYWPKAKVTNKERVVGHWVPKKGPAAQLLAYVSIGGAEGDGKIVFKPKEGNAVEGDYVVDKDKVKVTFKDSKQTWTIKSLTADHLVVEVEPGQVDEFDQEQPPPV